MTSTKLIELSSQMCSSESINQWQIKSKKLLTGAKPLRHFHPKLFLFHKGK